MFAKSVTTRARRFLMVLGTLGLGRRVGTGTGRCAAITAQLQSDATILSPGLSLPHLPGV